IFCALGYDRYATFHAGADLGLFTQTIASAFSGFGNTVENASHFSYHFSPILYLCAPLVWAMHSALALVFIQACATALVAPAIYAIARRRTSDANAAALACIALLYPPLQGVTFTDFHEMAFAPAAVAWLLWAIDARRFGVAAVLLAVCLSIKEDQAPMMAFVGLVALVYFTRRGERAGAIFGAAAIAASAVVFVGYFVLVRPLAGASSLWVPSHFYAWSGYAHAQPWTRQLAERVTYLLEAFLPLAFIPLRSPVMLLALPGFAEVLGSREPLMYTMGQHYAGAWVPYVLIAFALAGAKLLGQDAAGARWIKASAVLCVLTLMFFSPLHLGHFLRLPDRTDAATDALIARIPRSASVGTYDEIYSHLGFYRRARIGLAHRPQYVLMDERYSSVAWDTRWLPQLRKDVAAGLYVRVASRDGVDVFRRVDLR
ncbi:MAG TPA: DUF2079 domain-containing protein, partial [Candidatus Baltobacteraceae bacterium]|nr:DUF2079 domain-containing protein [Candidatus Baltobacteraceae bacterium]